MTRPVSFVHTTPAARVVFSSGRALTGTVAEIERMGATRVMVIASPSQAELARALRAAVPVAREWSEVAPHVPVEVADRARHAATEARVDAVVAIGGGSAIGLAKAIALTTGIPIIAVPTTYAGSEATDVWGLTENGRKTTGSDPRVLPRVIVYDPELTASLPRDLAVASGLNALAHCVDSLWAPHRDPINAALATEGARCLASGMRALVRDDADPAGREQTLLGTYLAAAAFASAGSGLHHKICHVLGGTYGLPHAQTHAIVLPYVTAFTLPFAPDAAQRLRSALSAEDPLDGLLDLRRDVGAPVALRDHGFRRQDIRDAADLVLPVVPPSHPRPVTREDLESLLTAAWDGAPAEHLGTGEGHE